MRLMLFSLIPITEAAHYAARQPLLLRGPNHAEHFGRDLL